MRVDGRRTLLFGRLAKGIRIARSDSDAMIDDDEAAFEISWDGVARATWPRRGPLFVAPLFSTKLLEELAAASQWNRCATGPVAGSLADHAGGGELNRWGAPERRLKERPACRGSSSWAVPATQHQGAGGRGQRAVVCGRPKSKAEGANALKEPAFFLSALSSCCRHLLSSAAVPLPLSLRLSLAATPERPPTQPTPASPTTAHLAAPRPGRTDPHRTLSIIQPSIAQAPPHARQQTRHRVRVLVIIRESHQPAIDLSTCRPLLRVAAPRSSKRTASPASSSTTAATHAAPYTAAAASRALPYYPSSPY
ncbi:hypothetical protein PSPO01_15202 [Paraphaeosphaeria sporulosa]